MIILGINGSPLGGHDASACIVRDGRILVVAEEERFTRQKHAFDVFPHAAMQYCLAFLGITLDQVDHVAYSWDMSRLLESAWADKKSAFLEGMFPRNLFPCRRIPDCTLVAHHLAHAASTFWCSGFPTSSILVTDGQGEKASGVMAYGDRNEGIKIVQEYPVEFSLGYLYKAASGYAGLGRENPGKLMGLSSYGHSVHSFPLLRLEDGFYEFSGMQIPSDIPVGQYDNAEAIVRWWLDYFSDHFKIPAASLTKKWNFLRNEWQYDLDRDVRDYADFAASIQNIVESVGCHLVSNLVRRTGCSRLSLAGGVALNCSLNGKIAQMPEVEDLFVFPASHDSGTSVGAALQLSFDLGITPTEPRLTSCYLGPEYDNGEIHRTLDAFNIAYRELPDDVLHQEVAKLLCKKSIVAVFFGRSEIGPRALGNRSILAAPDSAELRDRVNCAKGRELWRPLCPSVLNGYAQAFFHNADKGSPFMLRFLPVREDKKKLISGVVHVDDTARVQLVAPESNFGRMIEAYRKQSGLPMVLNTSFNLAGEPIVGSPIDAFRSFFTSSIDALVLGNYLICK